MQIKKVIALVTGFLSSVSVFAAGSFSLSSASAVAYQDEYIKGTNGSAQVFVVDKLTGDSKLIFVCPDQKLYNCKWFTYATDSDSLTPITDFYIGSDSTVVSDLQTGKGYMLQYTDSASSTVYKRSVWLTAFQPITSVAWVKDTAYCERVPLFVQPVMSYELYGRDKYTIKRKLDVTYDCFEMSEGKETDSKTVYLSADSVLYITEVPTVNTTFSLKDEDHNSEFESDTFYTTAVNAFPQISANASAENEIEVAKSSDFTTDDEGNVVYYFDVASPTFRTSGPLYLNLKSNASPGVDDYIWQIAYNDSTFSSAYSIYNKPDIYHYEISKPGNYWIKLIVKNKQSDCDYQSAGKFTIKQSELYIPNAFSPNADDANDEFKVAYRSIESFECHIYNQWGRLVYESNDVSKGWDGKQGSSDAPTGVYFYVIKARGTDGIEYNKKGTVNLLRSSK